MPSRLAASLNSFIALFTFSGPPNAFEILPALMNEIYGLPSILRYIGSLNMSTQYLTIVGQVSGVGVCKGSSTTSIAKPTLFLFWACKYNFSAVFLTSLSRLSIFFGLLYQQKLKKS